MRIYTIEKKATILRQNIDLKDASFPVVADPTWCGNTISSYNWANRGDEGGLTLMVSPTWCGRILSNFEELWTELVSNLNNTYGPTPWMPNRDGSYKYSSMYNQLKCHFQYFVKSSWNIEYWRKNYSWNFWAMKTPAGWPFWGWQCNPPKA